MKFILVVGFTFLQHITTSWCYDIELDGTFNFGKDFLKQLQNEMHIARKQNPTENEYPGKDMTNLKSTDNNLLYRSNTENQLKQLKLNSSHDNTDTKNSLAHDNNYVFYTKAQISTEGEIKLRSLAYNILNSLNLTLDIYPILHTVSKNFTTELDKYSNFLSKQQVHSEIEREFYILDLVATANRILFRASKTFFDTVMAQANKTMPETAVNKLMKDIMKAVVEERKNSLVYICKKLRICRPFPAYSDHVAELLTEILKLSHQKFQIVLKLIKEIIEMKIPFFKTIMNEDVAKKVGKKFELIAKQRQEGKKFVTLLREILTHRHKIFRSKDGEIKIKKVALRILIDMVDKAFEKLEESFVHKEFQNVIRGLKSWVDNESIDVETILTDFCNNLASTLDLYWDLKTKENVKALIQVLVTGHPGYSMRYDEDLFTKGSKFVRGEGISSYVDDNAFLLPGFYNYL